MKQLIILALCFAAVFADWDEEPITVDRTPPNINYRSTISHGIELGPCPTNEDRVPCSPTYPETVARLQQIVSNSKVPISMLSAGQTRQGREMWYAKLGTGSKKYMAWGRIHGDECVGTEGLLKLLEKLTDGRFRTRLVLKGVTLIIMPILNADGSEAGTRRSAPYPGWPDGQDLNRDWCPRNTNDGPSPCRVNATQEPISGRWLEGVPGVPCSCPINSSSFITNEINNVFDLYLAERPDVIMDIHQFGSGFLEGNPTKLVTAQAVIPRFTDTFSEEIVYRNIQVAQVVYDSIEKNGGVPSRWRLTFRPPGEPSPSSHRTSEDGRRDINDPPAPANGMGLEMRRVCPAFEDNLEEMTFRIMLDQVEAVASRRMFILNPTEAVYTPFGVRFTCTTPCPDELPEEFKIDREAWEKAWDAEG